VNAASSAIGQPPRIPTICPRSGSLRSYLRRDSCSPGGEPPLPSRLPPFLAGLCPNVGNVLSRAPPLEAISLVHFIFGPFSHSPPVPRGSSTLACIIRDASRRAFSMEFARRTRFLRGFLAGDNWPACQRPLPSGAIRSPYGASIFNGELRNRRDGTGNERLVEREVRRSCEYVCP